MLRKYETLFVVQPDLPEDQLTAIKTKTQSVLTGHGGHEIVYQDWGKRKLAYPIKKFQKGNYLYYRYLGDGKAVAEIERSLRVNDVVLRYISVVLTEEVKLEGFDFDADRATVFPFGARPRSGFAERPEGFSDDEGGDDRGDDRRRERRDFGRDRDEAPGEFGGRGAKADEITDRDAAQEDSDEPEASGG
jgi:small subunit ribosomal protein S6